MASLGIGTRVYVQWYPDTKVNPLCNNPKVAGQIGTIVSGPHYGCAWELDIAPNDCIHEEKLIPIDDDPATQEREKELEHEI